MNYHMKIEIKELAEVIYKNIHPKRKLKQDHFAWE